MVPPGKETRGIWRMKSDVLDRAIVPVPEFNEFIRRVFRHKACISLAVASWLFTCILAPGDRLDAMNIAQRAPITGPACWPITCWAIGLWAMF